MTEQKVLIYKKFVGSDSLELAYAWVEANGLWHEKPHPNGLTIANKPAEQTTEVTVWTLKE